MRTGLTVSVTAQLVGCYVHNKETVRLLKARNFVTSRVTCYFLKKDFAQLSSRYLSVYITEDVMCDTYIITLCNVCLSLCVKHIVLFCALEVIRNCVQFFSFAICCNLYVFVIK